MPQVTATPNPMPFFVVPHKAVHYTEGAYLVVDEWNDYGYVTMFTLLYRESPQYAIQIGQVKVGRFGMGKGEWRPRLPESFNRLDDSFFSLGQDATYYEILRDHVNYETRIAILAGLRDMAFDIDLYHRASREQVTIASLLRSINPLTVEEQFHRIAHGGVTATRFEFRYTLPRPDPHISPLSLNFSVAPDSYPPTNIHALIGSNGVGKTRLLRSLAQAVADPSSDHVSVGRIYNLLGETWKTFANMISVSFNAFDSLMQVAPRALKHTYVSLAKPSDAGADGLSPLAVEFAKSFDSLTGARLSRWRIALKTLAVDPVFQDMDVVNIFHQPRVYAVDLPTASGVFDNLSAGHKIVLLAMVRIVDNVGEQTLVLIDEPETHLHPPLLSAFIRALSELLHNQNGVAIVATHSPVVLQETPKSCVWKLRRSGQSIAAERPAIETFGENVGVLTREVFGLEVTRSGFHTMLENAVQSGYSFEQILDLFNGQLGGEALGLLRVLVSERDRRTESPF